MYTQFRISCPPVWQEAADIIARRLTYRGLTAGNDEMNITLVCDNTLGDTYKVNVSGAEIILTASIQTNILAAAGVFMRAGTFVDDGFIPVNGERSITPDCIVRGAYFANHFHNYYQTAPVESIAEYIEDLAIWGYNTIDIIMPFICLHHADDEEAMEQYERLALIFKRAKKLGMFIKTGINVNQTTIDYPQTLRAQPVPDPLVRHGNSGNVVCISDPEGQAWIDRENRILLEEFRKRGIIFDYVSSWPYDEGGCGCPKCAPWGANGYIRGAKHAFDIVREYAPECKCIVSTWTFDTPYLGEWEALSKSLEEEKWCEIIQADAHEDFPRYPLDNGVPGNLPLISFPEISMWGLYPWGGWGAVPLHRRITSIWQQTEHKLSGEILYSEGIYEDITKATVAGLCVDFDRDPAETIKQYARYEIGCPDPEAFLTLVDTIEKLHTDRVATDGEKTGIGLASLADSAWKQAQKIDASLPEWSKKCWRWRIIMIRALLETRRCRGEVACNYPDTLAAQHELIDLFYLPKTNTTKDPYLDRVRPTCPEY